MNPNAGLQQAAFASRVQQDLTAAPVIDGTVQYVPTAPGTLAVLLAGQTDGKENGLYNVSKSGLVITWARVPLTAQDCQIQVAALSGQGLWSINGTPVYGTDAVTVRRV